MSKSMKEWFAEQDFDTGELPSGHRERFWEKLNDAQQETPIVSIDRDGAHSGHKKAHLNKWFKWSLVAGLAVLLGFAGMNFNTPPNYELASVSPEMANTQDFFTNTITEELKKLELQKTPQTEKLIADTKLQLLALEDDYQELKTDLETSSNSRQVIAAMIQNFQSRIDILQITLDQIETLNHIKSQSDETIL